MNKNMSIGSFALALALACPFTYAADPAPNPISNFLTSLQKIAAGPKGVQADNNRNQAGQASPPNITGSESDDIMRSVAEEHGAYGQAAVTTTWCKLYFEDDGKILLAQKTGKFMEAGIQAKLRAANVAACALNGYGAPLAQAKDDVGHLLAISSINLSRAGMSDDDTVLHAKYAMTLLKLNEEANQSYISAVENAYWPKGAVVASQAFVAMTSKDAATKYQENTFAFQRQYTNKTMQIKGRVQKITGSANRATINLEGIVKKDINDQGWQDIVQCNVKNKDALDDAARISKGDTITVQGVFVPGVVPGVSLDDCRLLR